MNLQQVCEWRDAAVADGWQMAPTGSNTPAEHRATLTKDGYIVLVDSYAAGTYWVKQDTADISIWGPDGLAIKTPEPYSMKDIIAGTKVCAECGKVGETVRVGFAGRVCPACRVKLAPKLEYPGWTS